MPSAPPGEVLNLRIAADLKTLTWDPTPGATSYNVYRAYVRDLSPTFYGLTLDAELTAATDTDSQTPAADQSFGYLVTAVGSGEGTLGTDRQGNPRPNTYPWPGYAVAGKWSGLRGWPEEAIHMAVLHTGKVITWKGAAPTLSRIYDPIANSLTTQQIAQNLFCSGHSFLADGKLLVTGGNTFLFSGPKTSYTFDPTATVGWSLEAYMEAGRYYPTNQTKGDGDVLTFSGNQEDGERNIQVETYNGSGWTVNSTGHFLELFPMMHLLPSGKIFHAGPEATSETYDPVTLAWTPVATSHYGLRNEGTSVLIPDGGFQKVMIAGGRNTIEPESTNTVEIIDLSAATPSWSYTAPMHFKRIYPNSVLLPDGTVLLLGGGYDDNIATYPSEIYDPALGTWTVGASMRSYRLYHSTAALLPDGRVMAGGSNGNTSMEFYSPPYLFKGARPTISSAPASVRYAHTITVGTPDAASITSVVFMRPGAVTHAFNQNQRYVPLSFTAGSSSLTVTAPSNKNTAPPGYYMLFILKTAGIPSEAKFVQLTN